MLAIVVVIGLQLLPSRRRSSASSSGSSGLRPLALSVGFAVLIAFAGATVSSQGVAPFIYFRF